MQEEKNTQEDSKHTGKFRALSVVLVVAVALFVSSPISAFAEKFPTLPGVGTGSGSDNSWMENNPLLPGNNPGSGADSGTGEDTGNSEENDTADLSKDSSQWVDRDKSGIYDGSINSMIDSDEEEADEPEQDSGMKWFVDVINAILTFIPIQIANALYSLLNMLGASLDNLIYGRLVSDVALFTFGLENGNVYGIIGSIIYNILRGISLLGCMTVFMANISISSYKQGRVAWDKLKESITIFLTAALLLVMMPYFLDVGLFVRDNVLYILANEAGKTLFGDSSTSIIAILRDAADESFLNSIMYLGSVILNIYFMLSYVGVALAMLIDFILFPFVIIKSFFDDRQALSNWVWEMVSCALVPIIDATLIMVPVYIGVFASRVGLSGKSLAVAMLQILICASILPARDLARRTLGMQTNPLERAGLGAGAFVGAMAARGIGNAVHGISEDRSNAKADENNAQMEDELAQLDAQEMEQANQAGFGTAASAYAEAAAANEQKGMGDGADIANAKPSFGNEPIGEDEDQPMRPEDFASYDDGTPFGQEQTYGEAMAANQDTLDAEDKESIDRALKDTDAKLAKVRDRKKELDFENADKSQYPELAAEYSDLMQEENALLAKKERLQARSDQELLKEEPANLQKAISDADSEKEQLLSDRQVKVRERNQLQAQRDLMTGDSSEYQKLGESISAKDNEIRQIDTQIQDCESRSYSASKALRAQENELRDRQAYNLGERVKAQQEYDTAAAELERYKTASGSGAKSQKEAAEAIAKQQKIMENASSRMADLSVEDARINEKLQEFDPNRNQYSMSDLQRAKSAQQVRRAEAQSRIAVLNAEIGALDPSNTANKEAIEQKRQKIRQLTAITADAGLQTARLDQMISGLKENGGYSASAGKASSPMGRMGAASSEYERKRQAIMERYATIDNFEEPQFNNISHERRAELLRGRALHSRLQSTAKIRGMMIGGSLGALTGMYMGPVGMVVGGMIGNATYTPFRNLSVNWRTNKGLREAGAATRSYANSPLDVKVYSDLNGKSVPEQMKVIDIVSRDFAKSLEKDGKLEQIFNDDLVNDAAMRESRKALLKKYNIKDAQGYESAVNRLRNEFSGTAKAIITEKETRMLERCAGEQYVNLSEKSKKRIMDKVIGSRDIALDNQLRTTLNVYLPKKWEDSFLR